MKLKTMLLLHLVILIAVTLGDTVGCFDQSTDPRRQITPTTYRACYGILDALLSKDKATAEIPFSRRSGVGFKVPEYWTSGNCVMVIDMHSENDVDSMSFLDIATEAGVIMVKCVMYPPHLGGTQPVGPKRVLNVTVFGYHQRVKGRPWPALPLEPYGSVGRPWRGLSLSQNGSAIAR